MLAQPKCLCVEGLQASIEEQDAVAVSVSERKGLWLVAAVDLPSQRYRSEQLSCLFRSRSLWDVVP